MGINNHLNWDTYRMKSKDIVDEHPELAVAIVKRDFSGYVEVLKREGLDDLLTRLHFDVANADIREGSEYTSHEYEYWDDEDVEIFEALGQESPEPVAIVNDLRDAGLDMSWVSSYDWDKVASIREDGIDSVLASEGNLEDASRTIIFPNAELAVVWLEEILGQISDGAWENAPQVRGGKWKLFHDANVFVDEDFDEVVYQGPKLPAMGFGPNGKLGEHEGMFGRMVYYVRASGVNPDYTVDELKSDLRVLNDGL